MHKPKVQISIRAVLIFIAMLAVLLGVLRILSRERVFTLLFIAMLALPSLLPLLLAWFTRSRAPALSVASLGSAVITALYTVDKLTTGWAWDLTGNFSGMVVFALPFSATFLALYLCIVGTALVHMLRVVVNGEWTPVPVLLVSLVILVLGGGAAIMYGVAFVHWPQPIPG